MLFDMRLKAANTGDQVKHSILLEILQRVPTSLKIQYSETHAGAGIYTSFHQTFHSGEKKPYIEQLLAKHQACLPDEPPR